MKTQNVPEIHARQAIVTTFICPTNFRGARVKAKCERGSKTIEWEDALNIEQNHWAAAQALIDQFCAEDAKEGRYSTEKVANPWNGRRIMGGMPGKGYCHVFAEDTK